MRDLTDVALQLALDMKTTPGMPTTIKYIPKLCLHVCVSICEYLCIDVVFITSQGIV